MGSIWLKEFTGGLDVRRMTEATSGAVMVKAMNGHVTRGGEFEQRAAFVPEYSLPAGTVSLAYTPAGIVVFGHLTAPILPTGVTYQRLQHPTPAVALVRVLSTDLYAGKIYAVGEFADGSLHHFYDGVRVTDWFDGRARATFDVTGGVANAPVAAVGSFDITGGTAGGGNEIASVPISGVDALGAPVAWTTSNAATAAAVAAQINSFTSSPDYTATSMGATVRITAALTGTAANGRVVAPTVGGNVVVSNIVNMAGGSVSATSQLTNLRVNGVSVIGAPVSWATDNQTTATNIAAAINSFVSTPDYTASVTGTTVNIAAVDPGPASNGYVVSFSAINGLSVTPTNLALADGGADGGTKATGKFTIIGGTPANTILPSVNGVALTSGAITAGANAAATAALVAAAINSHVSTPNYNATVLGATVTVETATNTTAVNGLPITFVLTGPTSTPVPGVKATGSFRVNFQGSIVGPATFVFTPYIQSIPITSGSSVTVNSSSELASAVASRINSFTSTPDYTATASGDKVTVRTATETDSVNGETFTFSKPGSVGVSSIVKMAGGVDPSATVLFGIEGMTPMAGGKQDNAFQPGEFVRTIGQKVYSTSGPNMHFSGIQQPTKWTTDAVGAGFVDMSSETSGSEQLTALARYRDLVAVFAPRVVQVWFVDPDPKLNRQVQVLNNTGTASPRSVTSFGDADLFYLDESGLRSLRARDQSTAAVTTDIGTPIDDLLVSKLKLLNDDERRNVIGLIEPQDGRFWLIMPDGTIFVFSYFTGAKVSAWSTYQTIFYANDVPVPFTVTDAVVYNRRVYLRSGNTIFVYGGLGGEVYDETVAEAWLPYLDANDPTRMKHFNGLDVAVRGLWSVSAAMSPNDEPAEDLVGIYDETTYNLNGKNVFDHHATHISLRFRSQGIADIGGHRLGACVIQYEGDDDDD